MAVQNELARVDYVGSGVATLAVPFYFLDDTHLKVTRTQAYVETILVLNSDYTVTGAGNPTGGSIICTVAPTASQTVAILRNVPQEQQTEYVEGDPFPAASHERALDYLTMLSQQNKEVISRAFVAPVSSVGLDLELPPLQAGFALGVNSTATALVMVPNTGAEQSADLASTAAGKGSNLLAHKGSLSGEVGILQYRINNESVCVSRWMTDDQIADVIAGTLLKDVSDALQAAITVATTSGCELKWLNGDYKITKSLTIPASFGWKFSGGSVGSSSGGTRIVQFTANTPIITFLGANTWGWAIDDFYFDYNTPQPAANTSAICLYANTGTIRDSIYNWQLNRCVFANCFRAISTSAVNANLLWGIRATDCVFGSTITGSAFYTGAATAGQPRIRFINCLVDATSMTEASFAIVSADTVTFDNIEWLNGSIALSPFGLMNLVTCYAVTMIGCRSEGYAFGASSGNLWNLSQCEVKVINCLATGFTGTGTPNIFKCLSGSRISINGLHLGSSMTAGMCYAFGATDVLLAANINVVGNYCSASTNAGAGLGAYPRVNLDACAPNATATLTLAEILPAVATGCSAPSGSDQLTIPTLNGSFGPVRVGFLVPNTAGIPAGTYVLAVTNSGAAPCVATLSKVTTAPIAAASINMFYAMAAAGAVGSPTGKQTYRVQQVLTNLTATSQICLPTFGVVDGCEFEIVLHQPTPAAFTFTVTDTVGANSYVIPVSKNGWVKYRATGPTTWQKVAYGTT